MKTKYLYSFIFSTLLFAGCEKSFDENVNQGFIEQGGDTVADVVENEFWAWSDKYPGIINSELERAMDVEVVVKGGYAPVSQAPNEPILHSTGLYVGNNERVKINVPEGVEGLNYQIGISQKLHEDQVWVRYSDIVTRGKLHSGENAISSWFGGFLYVYYDVASMPAQDITLTIDNAVPTYDFVDGETKTSEWVATIRDINTANTTADEEIDEETKAKRRIDWLELRSDKVIITGGIAEVIKTNLTDPSTLLKSYETAVDQYRAFAGLDGENQAPFRIYSDIQIEDAGQTSATKHVVRANGNYPLGILRGTTGLDEERLLNKDNIIYDEGITWVGTVNAISAAFSDKWQQSYNFDSFVNLLATHYYTIKAYGRMPGNPIDVYKIFTTILNTPDDIENDFNSMSMNVTRPVYEFYSNFRNTAAKVAGIPTKNLAFSMFFFLAEYAGWDLFPYIYEMGRELNFEVDPDNLQAHYDFFMMRACEYTDRNLAPYFRAWYMPISSYAMEYMNNFTPLGDDEQFWVNTPDRDSFWLNYNPANANFEPRTPNQSFMATIGEKPVFNWHSQYNLYEKLILQRRNSNTGAVATMTKSAMKPDGRLDYNLVDGLVSTHCFAYNNLGVIDTKNKKIHIDIINFYFQQPTDINCMRVANGDTGYFASHIQDMAWMDENDEWHDIVGQTFSIYTNLNKNANNALEVPEYMIFQFEEIRKMKALKIEVRTTKNKPQTQFGEIGFGLYAAPTAAPVTPPAV